MSSFFDKPSVVSKLSIRIACLKLIRSALHLNFRKFPVTNGTEFPGILGNEYNLARYTEIFRNFLPGISVRFDFPSGFSVAWFAFQKFDNFRIFRILSESFVPVY